MDGFVCQRCGVRQALRHSITVVGPFDIREDHLCVECHDLTDAEAAVEPVSADGSSVLGPIDFDVLRASIRRNEPEICGRAAFVAFAAGQLRAIASAHGQTLPPDVKAFLERHE